MPCLGTARLGFNSLKTLALTRPSFTSSCFTTTHLLPRRAFSVMAQSHHDLFNYTSGRWVFNDALRLEERRLVFDLEGLGRLAAQSVGRSPADLIKLSKLAEGGFNRIFLLTFRDDFQMVARVPYPLTVPKYYTVASEVATMDYLRSSGLPVPQVYAYSLVSDNAAKTEYIFMEFIRGRQLSEKWPELGEPDIASILRQVVQLESRIMSIPFPAGGSIYYTQDLEKMTGRPIIPLKDERFCVGPDTRLHLWYGRRSQLDIDRGPHKTAEAVLVAAARKELAYLERFGQPLLPFRRERRPGYQFKEQPPSDHIETLKRYLLIAPSLIPKDPTLSRFCIRHPDFRQSNIIVQRQSSDSSWQVASLLDWQHASVLPLFLHAGVPQLIQNYNDPISQSMTPPSLPEKFDELEEEEQSGVMDVYRRQLGHYHYVKNTEELNESHYDVLTEPMCMLRSRLFDRAGCPWEGETINLKVPLIQATEGWEMLTGGGVHPCPVVFDAEDVRKTMELDERLGKADMAFGMWQGIFGVGGPEGWVPAQGYEEAMARCREAKEEGLEEAEAEEERAEILGHWPWDDIDEGKYL